MHGDVSKHHDALEIRHNEMMNDLAVLFEALTYDEIKG